MLVSVTMMGKGTLRALAGSLQEVLAHNALALRRYPTQAAVDAGFAVITLTALCIALATRNDLRRYDVGLSDGPHPPG